LEEGGGGGDRREMWWKVKKARLGLIDKRTSEVSDATEEEAQAVSLIWWHKGQRNTDRYTVLDDEMIRRWRCGPHTAEEDCSRTVNVPARIYPDNMMRLYEAISHVGGLVLLRW